MVKSKYNKFVLWFLVLLAILIWGNFIFKVKNTFQPAVNQTNISTENFSVHSLANSFFPFMGEFDDPFIGTDEIKSMVQEPVPINPVKIKDMVVKDPSIKTKVLGIIGETVIVNNNNSVTFQKENQSEHVHDILNLNKVDLSDSSKKLILKVNNNSVRGD
jgi:hypothetical protein